ncbi:MAG TPA: TolC family protein [Candidatus Eisenbacteria bacterium]|nr:TolC family protein [Candidatus Eisenbacteria bacterium]
MAIPVAGAQPVRLTLRQALDMARGQSPSAMTALHRYRASYWQYVTFKADYRPSFDLSSTPVQWERTIELQTLPDGTDAFVPRSQANSSGTLALSKVVTLTGGRISLRSSLERTREIEGAGPSAYSATPIQLAYDQQLFAYNSYKWGLRIEPKRFAEARQMAVEDLETVSATTIGYFFDLLSSQASLRDALTERARAETLVAVVRRRFDAGKVPENDMLQAELTNLNSDLRLTRARVDHESRQQRLGNYLGVGDHRSFELVPATDVPEPTVDLPTAIAEARRNRPTAMAWSRRLIEADRSVAQARSQGGSTWLHASYGLSNTTDDFSNLYREQRTDQQALFSLSFPIIDWGRSRARVAVAESQREVTKRDVEQAQIDFERDIFFKVTQFQIQSKQLHLSFRADSIADRRYRKLRERYLGGEGDLNSVNIALNEKESARRGYLDALRSYWSAYYDLRRGTLYDFERRQAIPPPKVSF